MYILKHCICFVMAIVSFALIFCSEQPIPIASHIYWSFMFEMPVQWYDIVAYNYILHNKLLRLHVF